MSIYHVHSGEAGQRLDVFAHNKIPDLSRSSVKKLLEDKKILVNKVVEKPSYHMRTDDVVRIDYDVSGVEAIQQPDIEILYEDDDCIVMNKPTGVLTHSKGSFNPEWTVATFIHDRLIDMSGERGGIVHRLDRATSGVIIAAKTHAALSWLQKQFSQRKVKKSYFAIVDGHLQESEAVIEMPIERHPRTPKLFRTSAQGKPATTYYFVTERGEEHDLVRLQPTTGRTHQLRVHMKQLGHPITGDALYGGTTAKRLFLHAHSLEITLPSRTRKVFEVPIPSEFRTMMTHDKGTTLTPTNSSRH